MSDIQELARRLARNMQDDEPAQVSGHEAPVAVTNQGQILHMTGGKRWASSHDSYWGATQTHDELPAGLYRCDMAPQIGPVLTKQSVEVDALLELPDNASEEVISEFRSFWKLEDSFRKYGFIHKRGFLLWGPPGSGKTSTVQLLIKKIIKDDGGVVVLIDHPVPAAKCLHLLRSIENKRPVVCVIEDLDALVHRYGENEYLALLDGEAQIDRVVFLATTNYPENLDARFKNRPSRFDTVKEIGMPSDAAREFYLRQKCPDLTDDVVARWVSLSDGFSVAHLKEMMVLVLCLGKPVEEAVERLEKMREMRAKSTDTADRPRTGFAIGRR